MTQRLDCLRQSKLFTSQLRGRNLAPDTGDFLDKPDPKKNTPKIEDCFKLEEAMNTDRDKFLVWFLVSCPVRKGTLRQLKFSDLKPLNDTDVPYWLRIDAKRLKGSGKGKYKKAKHIGFLHYYAVQKLEAYKAELKAKGIIYNENSPLFMSYKSTKVGSKKGGTLTNIFAIFTDASEKAFKDLTKKRFSPQDFRDVISTVLRDKIKITSNLTKPLTSHTPQGIEAVYESSDDSEDKPNSDLLAVFKSCIPFLVPETIPELKIELNEQKADNEKQQSEIEAMKEQHSKDIDEMKAKFDELVSELKKGAKVMPTEDSSVKYRRIMYTDKNGKEISEENQTEEVKAKLKKANEEDLTEVDKIYLKELLGEVDEVIIYNEEDLTEEMKAKIKKLNEAVPKEIKSKFNDRLKKINDKTAKYDKV